MATATPAAEKRATARFTLTERELKEYSLSRAILTSAENQDRIERNCLELEISQTIRSESSKRVDRCPPAPSKLAARNLWK